ncbi:molybdopterin molybdotransferase MoeA [Sphingomonas sp. ac-8]|uniref:molybdopterin molybdotransferase MoeA n=1 Tax=Sphingomonas sp. ac-8 TaxID=3242977 RepID=UPI003A8063C8
MIGFDEASARIAAAAQPLRRETLPLPQAHGRVLASAVLAQVDSPPSAVSAMDGYALRSADLGAYPLRLRIAGEALAGSPHPGPVEPGSCVRIFTGGQVPAGADRVVIQERVTRDGETAVIEADPGAARHVRTRGCDFAAGDLLLPAGRLLDYRALVAAAGADCDRLELWQRPRLALLGTGDELVAPGTARGTPDRIPESVSFGVLGLARDWGADPVLHRRLPDDLPTLAAAAAEAVDAADLVVVTGGASAGDRDFARAMFAPLGLERRFDKVAIRPGKPVWFGRVRDTLVLGLPGNPTAALLTARLFLAPLLAGLSGRDPAEALRWRPVPLAASLAAGGERESFVRARWTGSAAEPLSDQDAGAQRTLAEATLLLRRPAGAPAAPAGTPVHALDL